MKRTLIAAACLFALSAAHATYCPSGTVHAGQPEPWYPNRCNEGATPADPVSNTLTGEQRQQQGQLQGQAQRAESSARAASTSAGGAAMSNAAGGAGQASASAAGAGANAGAGAGAGNSNGQSTTVYAGGAAGSGDSYRSLSLALPSVPMTPPSFVAGATVTTTVSACGPLQRVVAEPVYGEHNGLFSNSQVLLGNTERTETYLDEAGRVQPYTAIGGRFFGHQIVYSTAALGVSSASNLTIGGGGSGGGWGQGGGGSSGAMQRLVTSVQLRLCDVAPVVVAVPPPERISFEIAPMPPVATVAPRKPARRPIARQPVARKVADIKPDACLESAAASCRVKQTNTIALGQNQMAGASK